MLGGEVVAAAFAAARADIRWAELPLDLVVPSVEALVAVGDVAGARRVVAAVVRQPSVTWDDVTASASMSWLRTLLDLQRGRLADTPANPGWVDPWVTEVFEPSVRGYFSRGRGGGLGDECIERHLAARLRTRVVAAEAVAFARSGDPDSAVRRARGLPAATDDLDGFWVAWATVAGLMAQGAYHEAAREAIGAAEACVGQRFHEALILSEACRPGAPAAVVDRLGSLDARRTVLVRRSIAGPGEGGR